MADIVDANQGFALARYLEQRFAYVGLMLKSMNIEPGSDAYNKYTSATMAETMKLVDKIKHISLQQGMRIQELLINGQLSSEQRIAIMQRVDEKVASCSGGRSGNAQQKQSISNFDMYLTQPLGQLIADPTVSIDRKLREVAVHLHKIGCAKLTEPSYGHVAAVASLVQGASGDTA